MNKIVIISFLMISVGISLLPHIVYALAKIASWIGHFRVTYRPYGIATLCMLGIWLVMFLYGNVFARYFFETKSVDIECKGLPKAFDGYRIVHISDLHLDGWDGHEEKMTEIVDSINALNADLVCFTGDLISLSTDELTPFIPILKNIKAKQGVVCIMGNHDYLPYRRDLTEKQRWAQVHAFQQILRNDLGWKMLLNEHIVLKESSDSVAIIGCENQSMGVHRVIQRGNLTKAMAGTEDMFPIILTHDPTHWRGEILKKLPLRYAEGNSTNDINSENGNSTSPDSTGNASTMGSLTLSGHTHSGQFRVFGLSAASFVYDEYDGLYTEGIHNLYINIGLGGTMPFRFGATPEITLLRLKSK